MQALEMRIMVVNSPIVDVFSPKMAFGPYHMVFLKEFILTKPSRLQIFDSNFSFFFNAINETVGKRVIRADARQPFQTFGWAKVYEYRTHVTAKT